MSTCRALYRRVRHGSIVRELTNQSGRDRSHTLIRRYLLQRAARWSEVSTGPSLTESLEKREDLSLGNVVVLPNMHESLFAVVDVLHLKNAGAIAIPWDHEHEHVLPPQKRLPSGGTGYRRNDLPIVR